MGKMKDTTKAVIKYLQGHADENLIAADIAERLSMEKRQVDGIFTSAIQRKNLGYREEAEIELADGSHAKVKYLRLNDDGLAFDPDAEE